MKGIIVLWLAFIVVLSCSLSYTVDDKGGKTKDLKKYPVRYDAINAARKISGKKIKKL